MANMTSDIALRTVLGMKSMRDNPSLLNLISSKIGTGLHRQSSQRGALLQIALRGSGMQKTVTEAPGGVESAKELLNEMLQESQNTFDESVQTCKVYHLRTWRSMERMRLMVSTYNANAADARGRVIGAQGVIATLTTAITQTTEAFQQHQKECRIDLDFLSAQIVTVEGDIAVMAKVLELTTCEKDATAAATNFLLVQCSHCNNAVYLQHDKVAKMLGALKSDIAKRTVKSSLSASFAESLGNQQVVALDQEGVKRLRTRSTYKSTPPTEGRPLIPTGGVNTSDVPTAPEQLDCQPTTKCSIGSSPNCQRLQDRFLAVQAGISDQRDGLEGEKRWKQNWCEETSDGYRNQLDGYNENLRQTQANLAVATKDQNVAEKGSHQTASMHTSTAKEYTRTMQECCDTQNTAKSEDCALKKIRGELMKLEKDDQFVADCVVSEWRNEECSASCNGGTGIQTRSVVVQSEGGGKACPPLRIKQICNDEPCPVDCSLNDWGGWSSCSAKCDGGVKERKRDVLTQPEHDGMPCLETEDEEACNIQSCSSDCVLSRWTGWSSCSKACNKGSRQRIKNIIQPAVGDGICWEPKSAERLQFNECNAYNCEYALYKPKTIVTCNSMVDVVIVIDGSASLGEDGFEKSKNLVKKLTQAILGGTRGAKVAVELFSGPKKWDDYLLCTGDAKGTTVDMEQQCGIQWVSHFTNNTDALTTKTEAMVWPRSTTLTSVALGQAENMLMYGREEANSVVIVVTDGVPMSQRNTKSASDKLQEKAKVIWVPVGKKAPLELIMELASLPQDEHVIEIDTFEQLEEDKTINDLVSATCPVLKFW